MLFVYAIIVTLLFLATATPLLVQNKGKLRLSKKASMKMLSQSERLEKAKASIAVSMKKHKIKPYSAELIDLAVRKGLSPDVCDILGINEGNAFSLVDNVLSRSSISIDSFDTAEKNELVGAYIDECSKMVRQHIESKSQMQKTLSSGQSRSQAYLETVLDPSVKNSQEEKSWNEKFSETDSERKRLEKKWAEIGAEVEARDAEWELKKAEHNRNMRELRPLSSTRHGDNDNVVAPKTRLDQVVSGSPHAHYLRNKDDDADDLDFFDYIDRHPLF